MLILGSSFRSALFDRPMHLEAAVSSESSNSKQLLPPSKQSTLPSTSDQKRSFCKSTLGPLAVSISRPRLASHPESVELWLPIAASTSTP